MLFEVRQVKRVNFVQPRTRPKPVPIFYSKIRIRSGVKKPVPNLSRSGQVKNLSD